jgi:hypothetical protein
LTYEVAMQECMKLLERDEMTDLYAECKRLEYEDPSLIEIEKFIGLGQEELLKQQCVYLLFFNRFISSNAS